MKLFINLDPLHPPLSGIGQYTYGITKAILDNKLVEEVRGQYEGRILNQKQIEQLLKNVNQLTTKKLEKSSHIRAWIKKIPGARVLYRWLKSFRQASHQQDPFFTEAIYWEPNFELQPYQGKSVTTIHDIAYLRHPEFHQRSRIEQLTREVPKALEESAHVITVSETSRREILNFYQLEYEKISIVTPGVAEAFHPYSEQDHSAICKKYKLPYTYILSLGTLEPRKNLKGLMQSYTKLPKELRRKYPLVLVGAKGWLMEQFSEELQALVASGDLIQLGYVPQEDLPVLISAATVMGYVSFYEGFGMPVAESMACGTAVLTSQGTSMEEVAKGAAILVNPYDTDDITQGLEKLLKDVQLRQACEKNGREAAKKYTWKHSAETLIESLYGIR